MVTEASAILVLKITFRTPSGEISKTLFCSLTDKVLCNIKIIHRPEDSAYSFKASAHFEISAIPFKNTNTSPRSDHEYFVAID